MRTSPEGICGARWIKQKPATELASAAIGRASTGSWLYFGQKKLVEWCRPSGHHRRWLRTGTRKSSPGRRHHVELVRLAPVREVYLHVGPFEDPADLPPGPALAAQVRPRRQGLLPPWRPTDVKAKMWLATNDVSGWRLPRLTKIAAGCRRVGPGLPACAGPRRVLRMISHEVLGMSTEEHIDPPSSSHWSPASGQGDRDGEEPGLPMLHFAVAGEREVRRARRQRQLGRPSLSLPNAAPVHPFTDALTHSSKRWWPTIPAEQIHVVTVSAPAPTPAVFARRFFRCARDRHDLWPVDARPGYVSIDMVQTELVRRLNHDKRDVPWPSCPAPCCCARRSAAQPAAAPTPHGASVCPRRSGLGRGRDLSPGRRPTPQWCAPCTADLDDLVRPTSRVAGRCRRSHPSKTYWRKRSHLLVLSHHEHQRP